MTYNTGNPIGSNDPRDLADNAQALDRALNDPALSFTDRLGQQRMTLAGMEQAATGITAVQASIAAQAAQSATEAARDAALLSRGIFASTADALSKGVAALSDLVGGSGGTNGTFDLAFSGGAGSGAAGRFVVSGGAVVSVVITAPGRGYTSAPTVSFAASTGLTGASATAVIADLIGADEYFSVPSADSAEHLILYRKESGSAAEKKRYSSKAAIDAVIASLRTKADVVVGKNLFNPADPDVVVGYYIQGANGNLAAASGFRATGYIPVTAGQSYSISHRRQYAWYNSSKVFISGSTTSDTVAFTVAAPTGAAYFRTAVNDGQLATFQVEAGSANTAYEAYKLSLAPAQAPRVGTDNIDDEAITPVKTSFFENGKNLFDKAAALIGYYVAHTGGAPIANASYEVSDYIPVTAGETYAMSDGVRFTTYFNSAKIFVSGGKSSSTDGAIRTVTVPEGVAFIRVTISTTSHDTFQFEKGDFSTTYEAYGRYLRRDVLPAADPASTNEAPEVVVPPTIYGVQSRECNVYFDNLFLDDASDYNLAIDTTGNVGAQQNERFTWTPAGAVTTGTMSLYVHKKRTGTQLVGKSMDIRAAAANAGSGMTKKVLIIGDSLVNAGVIGQTLLDIATADVMGITLLGTRYTLSELNRHEGRGGWSIASYATDFTAAPYGANPFWIGGAVNFPQYLINNAIAVPDVVPIHLGINDCFAYTADSQVVTAAATAFAQLDTLIASIKSAGAGIKVALMIPPPPSYDQDAFGASYGVGQVRWRHKRNVLLWARELIAKYAGQEANRIYLVSSNVALDTRNNMKRAAAAPVNSRNSAITAQRQNDGVHPADSGYQQMADALWAFLKFYA